MRVPVRPDGSALLLWAAACLGAGGLTWWDAQDAPELRSVAPVEVPPADDLVWVDAEDFDESFGLPVPEGSAEDTLAPEHSSGPEGSSADR